MNLIIDAGNTQVKLAVFNQTNLVYTETVSYINFVTAALNIHAKWACKKAIISSVKNISKLDIEKLKAVFNLIILSNKTQLPFKISYKTPETLGVDRIALASAAFNQYPKQNVLVIDAGTCITYDFINAEGVYQGGSISPGLQMRFKALHQFTDKLPLLTTSELDNILIGKSTTESIIIGVQQGVINEIDSFINSYRKKNKNLTVVLTGGDTKYLAKRLKNSIFANPIFLFKGLNSILLYNIS
ncbi:MAG TPA: type III pantothenate kinase [Flavobacteriaceae bacterium]|nr:type III pantothenate kinase [Flavobacteriaceae bacterium]